MKKLIIVLLGILVLVSPVMAAHPETGEDYLAASQAFDAAREVTLAPLAAEIFECASPGVEPYLYGQEPYGCMQVPVGTPFDDPSYDNNMWLIETVDSSGNPIVVSAGDPFYIKISALAGTSHAFVGNLYLPADFSGADLTWREQWFSDDPSWIDDDSGSVDFAPDTPTAWDNACDVSVTNNFDAGPTTYQSLVVANEQGHYAPLYCNTAWKDFFRWTWLTASYNDEAIWTFGPFTLDSTSALLFRPYDPYYGYYDFEFTIEAEPLCPPITGNEYVDTTCCSADEWTNHGDYVSCVAEAVITLRAAGEITKQEGGEIVRKAAQSNVGKPISTDIAIYGIAAMSAATLSLVGMLYRKCPW